MRRGLDKTFLENNLLRSPQFMALPPATKGWWLQLQALCSSQENGGHLAGAGKWGNGVWQSAMGNGGGRAAFRKLLELRLVELAGDDVIVSGYHRESEARYQANRERAAKGGQASAAQKAGATLPRDAASPEPEGADSLEDPGSDAQATLKRRSSAQGEERDVGEGNVSEGSVEAGEALSSEDPTPGSPTLDDPIEIDPTGIETREAPRPESAPDPASESPVITCLARQHRERR